MSRRPVRPIFVAATAVALFTTAWSYHAAEKMPDRELIRDSDFRRGFTVLQPEPGKRVSYGMVRGHEATADPVWDLVQWSSKYPLAIAAPEKLTDGSLRFSNVGKTLTLGAVGSDRGDLGMAVKASAEYGSLSRKSGEPWVHLLVEQNIANPPSLADLGIARLHVEAHLIASEKQPMPNYSTGLHAAQFQIFFSVQNLNQQSPGYGKYLWFGIPIYDDRHRAVPAYKARDTGGTHRYIFTPAGNAFSTKSTHDQKWITIDTDLLPLMREGLENAWRDNFLKESQSLADYRIAAINIGWEVPGTFETPSGGLQSVTVTLPPTKKLYEPLSSC